MKNKEKLSRTRVPEFRLTVAICWKTCNKGNTTTNMFYNMLCTLLPCYRETHGVRKLPPTSL